jgi:hypothetical protein
MPELINTLECPGEFDALMNLRPGEPYFLLVGRDRLAPGLLLRWASYNRRRAFSEQDSGKIDDAKVERELRKSTQAEEIAWAMKEYKLDRPKDKPKGQVAATRPTYTGHELPEATKLADAKQAAAARAASALNGAVSELAALADATEAAGDTFTAKGLRAEMDKLQHLSEYVKPSRPIPGQQS